MADKKYFQPQETANAIQDFYGGKNLFESRSGPITYRGITYTVNYDAGEIIANGTNNESTISHYDNAFMLDVGTYIVTGGISSLFSIRVASFTDSGNTTDTFGDKYIGDDIGNGLTFTVDKKQRISIGVSIAPNATASNIVFKPMLRLVNCGSSTFVPYSPSIKMLTNRLPNIPNGHYRDNIGRNLTSRLSTTFYDELKYGDFTNIKPADYLIGPTTNRKYWIAHRDYWYGYNTIGFTNTHHIILLPASNFGNGPMNDTNTTTGGYYNSKGKATVDQFIQDYFVKDFGDHIKQFKNLLSNSVTDGKTSGWEWYDSYGDLMSEVNIYGSTVWGNGGHNTGSQKEQFEIFRDVGTHILGAQTLWLKDVVSSTYFADAIGDGYAYYGNASVSVGLLPFAVLAA